MRTSAPFLCIALLCCAPAFSQAEKTGADIRRADLGRSVKFRCVVDKVMQAHTGWKAEEWMIREAAEAGFNIYSPRIGYDDLDAVRQVTAWCEQYGIFHLPWMRGTLAVGLDDPKADGQRVVWDSGSEQPLWSPNSDALWEWMTRYIVAYAELSKDNEHLLGVFLDYENYAPGRRGGNLYSLSYDRHILDQFAKHAAVDIPDLPPDERAPWLRAQGLHGQFETFQVGEWRRRCRELRAAVDAHDPAFQFWLYPVPGTPFLQRAAYPEFSTKTAPIVVADQSTYGRPSEFMAEAEAVKANREKLRRYREIPEAMDVNFLYAGGIDPVVRGADPEFCGKNAVAISDETDGYWIFYEGPKYKAGHPEYWKWFTWANNAIAEGRFEAQHAPRENDEGFIPTLVSEISATGFGDPAAIGREVEFPLHKLRRGNLVLLACKADQAVSVTLRDIRLGDYVDDLQWKLRGPAQQKLDEGVIAHDTEGVVRFTPAEDGVYFLGLSSGSCTYAVTGANVPVAIYAGRGVGTVHGAERLYFHVPEDTKQVTIQAQGGGQETVRVNLYDPAGEQMGTAQTTLSDSRTKVEVVPSQGGIWSLSLVKADTGALEDGTVRIDGVPALLSLASEHVFRPAP